MRSFPPRGPGPPLNKQSLLITSEAFASMLTNHLRRYRRWDVSQTDIEDAATFAIEETVLAIEVGHSISNPYGYSIKIAGRHLQRLAAALSGPHVQSDRQRDQVLSPNRLDDESELIDRIWRTAEDLPLELKFAFLEYFRTGRTMRSIAQDLSISTSTVMRRIDRATIEIRRGLVRTPV